MPSAETPTTETENTVASTALKPELPFVNRPAPRAFGRGRYGISKHDERDDTRYAWARVGPAVAVLFALLFAAPARATNSYCESADATTAGYGFCQPAVDVEGENPWGYKNNTNWQMVEDVIAAINTSTSGPVIAALDYSTTNLRVDLTAETAARIAADSALSASLAVSTPAIAASTTSLAASDLLRVLKAGDTMTGALYGTSITISGLIDAATGTFTSSVAAARFISDYGYITSGGNARGIRSVDLQSTRASASQVASGDRAVLLGGYANTSTGTLSALVGGGQNYCGADYSFCGGGGSNTNLGDHGALVGGQNNYIAVDAGDCFIGGGNGNTCSGSAGYPPTIGGGRGNGATDIGVVGGGRGNNANSGTVGGGQANSATGLYSTIPGGKDNVASGLYSFAAGFSATASQSGSAAFGDSSGITVSTPNYFGAHYSNGFALTGGSTTLSGLILPDLHSPASSVIVQSTGTFWSDGSYLYFQKSSASVVRAALSAF